MKRNDKIRIFFKTMPVGVLYPLKNYSLGMRAMYYRVAKELNIDICILRGKSGMYYLIRVE